MRNSELRDKSASKISKLTYQDNINSVEIEYPGRNEIWTRIDTIKDKSTGLYGYVLQISISEEIVISFRGTEMPTSVTTDVKAKYVGSPSQDAMLASGIASIKNGDLV